MTDYVAKSSGNRKAPGPRYSIIPGAFCLDDRPGIWHFRVLNLLGRSTDRDGWCVRSQSHMAQDINTTRETVNRAIRDLCEWGYVQKTDQGSDRKSVCFYRVIMDPPGQPNPNEMACDESITCDDSITGGCDGTDHRGVTGTVTGGVITAITPITTSLKRPSINDLERERARDEDTRSAPASGEPRLVLEGDREWKAWLSFVDTRVGYDAVLAFRREKAMVVFAASPCPGCPKPKLAPPPHSEKWEELARQRPVDGLSDLSKRMAGEAAK